MVVSFKFKEYTSALFGTIRRPIAEVSFQHVTNTSWLPITMLVDTGADYTLLPRFLATELGISFSRDCRIINTQGVGGKSTVYFFKGKIKVKIGGYERNIPVGFLDNDYIPPLLGRQEFFETFRVVFEKFQTRFEESR